MKKNKNKRKLWNDIGLSIIISFTYFPLLFQILKNNEFELKKENKYENITVEDMYDAINNSPNLNEEEKEYLINEDLYEDIIDYINKSNRGNSILENLDDYDIVAISEEDKEDFSLFGYYDPRIPNKIFIRNYEEKIDNYSDSHISHEHIHSLHDENIYNYIAEPFTTIVNTEYYTYNNSYTEEQKRLKVLMEIIGPYPIWNYCFTGDSIVLENSINEYLSDEDVYNLFELFKDIDNPNNEEIDKILSKLYFNIYGDKIENNEIIMAIYNSLVKSRNYFNITDDKDIIYTPISLDEAEKRGLLKRRYVYNKKIKYSDEEFSFSLVPDEGHNVIHETFDSEYRYKLVDGDKIKIEVQPDIWTLYNEEEAIKLNYLTKVWIVESEIFVENKERNDELLEDGYRLGDTEYNYDTETYSLRTYNEELSFCIPKEVPTIKDKFGLNNEKDKKLIK